MNSVITVSPRLKSQIRSQIYHKHKAKYLAFPDDVDILAFRIGVLVAEYNELSDDLSDPGKMLLNEIRSLRKKFFPLRLKRKLSRMFNSFSIKQ